MLPQDIPFSILDYGVAIVALLVLGLVVYLFMKFLSNHMGEMARILKSVVESGEHLADMTRGMADEFHRCTEEVRDMHRDFRESRDHDGERESHP